MILDQVPIAEVHPAPWNVRTGHAVDAIAESIRVNGFRDPIEAWRATGEIVCGEGRYLAARELGLETVPVVWHDFDSLASAKRYAIANNRLTDRSEFDLPALQAQLEELDSLAGTGFDDFDLMDGALPDTQPPAEPKLPSDVLIEIRCSHDDLAEFQAALDEWQERDGVTIDIS